MNLNPRKPHISVLSCEHGWSEVWWRCVSGLDIGYGRTPYLAYLHYRDGLKNGGFIPSKRVFTA